MPEASAASGIFGKKVFPSLPENGKRSCLEEVFVDRQDCETGAAPQQTVWFKSTTPGSKRTFNPSVFRQALSIVGLQFLRLGIDPQPRLSLSGSPPKMRLQSPLVWLIQCGLLLAAHALEWSSQPGYRVASLSAVGSTNAGFTLLDPKSLGIDFSNALSPQRVQLFQNLMNGSGLAAADVDGDGRVDLYFCHKQAPNQLYRNLGQGKFINITTQAGVGCTNQTSVGAGFGDLNGDGSPDLVVSGFGGPNALLLNNGKGHFTDITIAAGIAGKSGYTSMALADVDGDGDLDLYLCNFGVQAILRDGGVISTRMVNGQAQVTGRYANRLRLIDGTLFEFGEPDTLFLNDGKAHFTPVPWEQAFTSADGKPMSPPWDFGLAVQIRDANGDGFPDIYVCNDFQTPDRLWFGDGKGHFREASARALRNMSYASMGVDFADLDRDGRYDFLTVEMLSENLPQHLRTSSPIGPVHRVPGQWNNREDFVRNCLYWNRGDGTWAEIAQFAGIAATGWSWTPLFLDVDLDGWEDLLVSNGHLHDVNNRDIANLTRAKQGQNLQATKDKLLQYPPLETPKFAFRNRRDLTFQDVSSEWGFNSTRIAHGMIAVDFDEDGDLDVILNAMDGPPLIYRNDTTAARVAVRLRGESPNRDGIGSQILIRGGPVPQQQEMIAGGQYLSHSQTQRTFAAGAGDMELEVRWRSGKRSRIQGVHANHIYEVDERGAAPAPIEASAKTHSTLFKDVSDRLGHSHTENAFDDLLLQPLLPQLYSQSGPNVAWVDLDGDQHTDLFIGTGKGGKPGVFLGDGHGNFRRLEAGGAPLPDDLTGLTAWTGTDGRRRMLSALANYENGNGTATTSVLDWSTSNQVLASQSLLTGNMDSPAVIVSADMDGDGDLDLFVGARPRAERWPEGGGSRVYKNDSGTWIEEASPLFKTLGPVSDALWVPLEENQEPSLVIAEDWGGIRIFRRVKGQWEERTSGWDLTGFTGCWNSITAGDFNGDGRLDLILGNRGMNTAWQTWNSGHPLLFWTDLDPQSPKFLIEAAEIANKTIPIRDRDQLAKTLPELPTRIPTHQAYSESSVTTVLGSLSSRVKEKRVRWLASLILLNRGGKFEARALPREAQWSPAQGLAVADFDGDGAQDLFLAQNHFAMRPDDARLDGGRGLLLKGDGIGGFTSLSSLDSGITIDGDQRGAAAADFDEDGRMDLVIGQNGSTTQLLHNTGAAPGLRVRLAGPPGNPDGLGSVIIPIRGANRGAAHYLTSGSGHGSQAETTVVVGGQRPTSMEVRWPDGSISQEAVPAATQTWVIHWKSTKPNRQ